MYLKGEPFFCEALPKMKYSKVRVNTKEPGSATWWTHLLASFYGKKFSGIYFSLSWFERQFPAVELFRLGAFWKLYGPLSKHKCNRSSCAALGFKAITLNERLIHFSLCDSLWILLILLQILDKVNGFVVRWMLSKDQLTQNMKMFPPFPCSYK